MEKMLSLIGVLIALIFFGALISLWSDARFAVQVERARSIEEGRGFGAALSSHQEKVPAPMDDLRTGSRPSADLAGDDVSDWLWKLQAARSQGDEKGCAEARSGLMRLGMGAREALLGAFLAGDSSIQADVQTVLLEIGDESIAVELIARLGDVRDPSLVKRIVSVIVALARSDEPIAKIGALLAPGTPSALAGLAAEILGRLQDRRATPHLLDALWREEPPVRQAVATALEVLQDPDAAPELARHFRRMGSSDFNAKCSLGRAIAGSTPSLEALLVLSDLAASESSDEWQTTLYGFSTVARNPDALDEILYQMRTDPREAVRRNLTASLFDAPRDRVDAPLLEFIETEPSACLRRDALIVAGRMSSPQMVELLAASYLASADPEDVGAACSALRNALSCDGPRPAIRAMLLDVVRNESIQTDERVRCIQALARQLDDETLRAFDDVRVGTQVPAIRDTLDRTLEHRLPMKR